MAQIAMTPARFSLVTMSAVMGVISRQFSGSVCPGFGTHQPFQTRLLVDRHQQYLREAGRQSTEGDFEQQRKQL